MESRLEGFVERMRGLIKLEHEAEEEESTALVGSHSRLELESRGVCLRKMQVSKISRGHFGKTLLTLKRGGKSQEEEEELPSHKFSPGDLAGLFGSGPTPLETGVVSKAGRMKVVVSVAEVH